MAGLGFAREQLEKQGWKEGKGLGKEEDGIKEPIKVGIKKDTQGVGYKISDQFTFHWWDHIFNKAAKSIVVNEGEDSIEVSKTGSKYQPISTQRPGKHSRKPLLYGRFVKASTSSQVQSESDSDSEIEKDFSTEHVEDIVFKKCGGRTAHKGARHGLKLNGKLKRIEEHDKVAMSEPCSRRASPVINMGQEEDGMQSTSELQTILISDKKELSRPYSDSEQSVKKKKKKRERTSGEETSFDEDRHFAKSKKKKKHVTEEVRNSSDEFKTSTKDFEIRISREDARASEYVHYGTENVKKKKKRCSSKVEKPDAAIDFEQELQKGEQQVCPGTKKVKKKKKKDKRSSDKEMNNDLESTMEPDVKERRRKKKQEKSSY